MSHYKQDHLIAKFVVSIIISVLLHFDGTLTILNYLAIQVWIFGINPAHYIIESIKKHEHRSDKL